jgi:hypothetical protein
MRTRRALPVAGIILAAAIAASVFALTLVQYVVMPDELTYEKQSLEFAHGNILLPGDFWFSSWALLRPMLTSPFFRWLSLPHAFDAAHVTGALIMASAAWPAYLLARRATAWRPAALMVAAMSVAIPWLGMSATLMLEPVAYPAFLWAVLAMTNAVARPSWRADILFVLGIAVAFSARTQLGVLAIAFVIAVAVDAICRRDQDANAVQRLVGAARQHWLLIAAAVLGAVLLLATGSEARLLGTYSTPAHGSALPAGTGHAMHELLAYVVVGIGALPLAGAAAWLATTLGRRAPRDAHALAAVTLAVVLLMTLMAGSFTVRFTEGINDRYLFYIAPLLFTGFVAGVVERPRGWAPALAIAGVLTAVLIWTAKLAQAGPSLVSPSMSFHKWLADRAAEIGGSVTAPKLAALGALLLVVIGVVAALRSERREVGLAVASLVLLFCVAETAYTFNQVAATQSGDNSAFIKARSWIDRAVPYGARAAALLAPFGDPSTTAAIWWDTSFWNNGVRATYKLPDTSDFEQGAVGVLDIDPKTGRIPALDSYGYVVRSGADTRFGLRGSSTVKSAGAILLLTATRPYQADWLFEGNDLDNTVVQPGEPGQLTVFGDPGAGTATVVVDRPGSKPGRTRFTVGSESGSVKAGERATVRVPTRFLDPGYAKLQLSAHGGPLELVEASRS